MHFIPYIGAAYAVIFGWYVAQRWGEHARLDLLLSLVAVNVLLGIAAHYYESRVRREFRSMDPRTLADMRRHDPAATEFDRDRPRVNERPDWSWRAMDVLGGLGFVLYPAVIYSALRYRSFGGETPFDGFAALAVALGAFGYIAWRRRRLRSYQCPICRTSTSAQLNSRRIRFACPSCGWTWNLGPSLFRQDVASRTPT